MIYQSVMCESGHLESESGSESSRLESESTSGFESESGFGFAHHWYQYTRFLNWHISDLPAEFGRARSTNGRVDSKGTNGQTNPNYGMMNQIFDRMYWLILNKALEWISLSKAAMDRFRDYCPLQNLNLSWTQPWWWCPDCTNLS